MTNAGTPPRRIRRKNYFIDKKFQGTFILKFCMLVAATGLFIMVVLYSLSNKATTVSFINSRVVVQTTADFLFPLLIQTFVIATVFVGIATIFITLFISHRIAGPAYRFKKTLADLSGGNFSENCHLRRKDSLQDVAKALNDMMSNVRKGLTAVNSSLTKLKNKLGDVQKSKSVDDSELRELKKEASELDEALHHFKF
ncbi:MAG: methyl-accepting chemotaxis protein [Candidatus Omnitrophica bacterium]|nr:methyl-accepting chemotaxis protein [Candidatus Omnitrophota bacterium]